MSIPPQTLAYNGSVGAENTGPSGSSSGPDSLSTSAYAGGSYQRGGVYTWSISVGNLAGGISALMIATNWGVYQFGVSPAIPKTSSQTLILNVNQAWSRH